LELDKSDSTVRSLTAGAESHVCLWTSAMLGNDRRVGEASEIFDRGGFPEGPLDLEDFLFDSVLSVSF